MRWLIVGCGYTGLRLAERLVHEGEDVVVSSRALSKAQKCSRMLGPAVTPVEIQLGRGLAWQAVLQPGLVAVVLAPPGPLSPKAEEDLVVAAAAAGVRRLIYVSSTGVYGFGASDRWVDESAELDPVGATGTARKLVDEAIRRSAFAHKISAAVLRAPGIYGPGRGLHRRIREGGYRVIGDGDSYVSRIHVDDLLEAIILLARKPAIDHDAYNVADNEPCLAREAADGIAQLVGVDPPSSVPAELASPEAVAMLTANRRISTQRLRDEFGFTPRYPSWREGVAACLAAELTE